MKRFLSLLLAVVLTIGVFLAAPIQLPNFVVFANAAVEQETPTDPDYDAASFLTYSLSPDSNEYYVSGYNGEACDELVIPAEHEGKPVTKIGDNAFTLNLNIKVVKLPDTITEIGYEAFTNSSIEEIVIPDSVTYIAPYAFEFCNKLKKVSLSKNVKVIESQTFCGCTELTEIILPEGLQIIGDHAFDGCTSLEEIVIPGSVKEIRSNAFGGCSSLKVLTFLEGANGVTHNAFVNCNNIEKINLPQTHVNLMASYFKGSKIYNDKNNWHGDSFYIGTQLINTTWYKHGARTVRAGTTHLNPGAFAGTQNLIAVTIPASVKYIGDDAFNNSSISVIYYEGTESQFKQIDIGNNGERFAKMAIICGANKSKAPKMAQVKSTVNVAGGVQITWNKVANADLYAVYRRGASSNIWTLLGVSTENSVIDTSADHRKYWRYSVQAINDNGVSPFDNNGKYLKYVKTPTLTGLYNVKDGIELTWREVDGASGYRVYRRGAGQSWKYLGTVKGTAYLDKAIKNNNGKYYRYTVRAVVDGRYSGYEDYLYTMRLSTPQLVSAKCNDDFQFILKWKSVPSATGYYVYGYDMTRRTWSSMAYVKGGKSTTYKTSAGNIRFYTKFTVVAANGKYRSEFNEKGIET